ncbi:transposase family protein [Streptomyces sp. NPDC053720]|uniref:transposase family protein n=1 Tax=Streptomyces sp. NPDC053720 TaxID=3154855 RepID=UPI0034188003
MIILAVLRHDQRLADMAGGNAIAPTAVRRRRDEMINLLAVRTRAWSTLKKIVKRGGEVVLIDGTFNPTQRRTGKADRPNFSGKHHRHGLHFRALTEERGRMIWVSAARPGRTHDAGAARRDKTVEHLTAAEDIIERVRPGLGKVSALVDQRLAAADALDATHVIRCLVCAVRSVPIEGGDVNIVRAVRHTDFGTPTDAARLSVGTSEYEVVTDGGACPVHEHGVFLCCGGAVTSLPGGKAVDGGKVRSGIPGREAAPHTALAAQTVPVTGGPRLPDDISGKSASNRHQSETVFRTCSCSMASQQHDLGIEQVKSLLARRTTPR